MGEVRDYEMVVGRGDAFGIAWADQASRFQARWPGTITIIIGLAVGAVAFRGPLLAGWLIIGAAVAARVLDDAAAFVRVWRGVRARDAVGSLIAARYADDYLRLARGGSDLKLEYADLSSITIGRGHVSIWAHFGTALILPVELCPPVEQQRLADRIPKTIRTPIDRTPFPQRVVADEAYASALGWRTLALYLPLKFWGFGWLVWFGIAAALSLAPVPDWLWVVPLVLWLVFLGSDLLATLGTTIKQTVGLEMLARFEDDAFIVAERGQIWLQPYSVFDRIRRRGVLLELREAKTGRWRQYPSALFPPSAVARFPGP